ncbi:MAG: DUF6178 family protein [Desulfobacterales bacterium]|jgi:hypothetical protein
MTRKDIDHPPGHREMLRADAARREILALPPEKALETILDAPDTEALVRSFAEEDFYFLVHEIGPEDNLPLLAAASPSQWEYLLDLEAWQRDRFDPVAAEHWLRQLEKAAGPPMVRWLLAEKKDLLDLFLFHGIEVRVREHDQDPSEFGDDFFTLDDVYYIRVKSSPEALSEAAEKPVDGKEALVRRLLEAIADLDHFIYQHELLDAAGLLPAEVEEEAYRLRNVRLAEKGFAPPEEAVGIYQRLAPEALFQKGRKHLLREPGPDRQLPAPLFADGMFDAQGLFARALSAVGSSTALLQLQQEFAGLCNRVIAADQTPVRERESLRAVVEKTAGYLSVGLEHLTGAKKGPPAVLAARLIEAYPLIELFRVGHGLAMELKWRAGRWRKQSWFEAEANLPLTFWDEKWVGVIGGLLLSRPRFFDDYRTVDNAYREFASLQDVRETEQVLDQVIRTDQVLSHLSLDTAGPRPRNLTYKNLLFTLWASDETGAGLPDSPSSLVPGVPLEALKRFHRRLFPKGPPADAGHIRRIADSVKADFIRWLSGRTGIDPVDLGEQIGPVLEALFCELEEELAAVAAGDLDPRFIRLFLVARQDAASG